jgi:hypothetical protein
LIEARGEKLARILDEVGHSEIGHDEGERDPGAILERELGLARGALDERLARWAAEMGD